MKAKILLALKNKYKALGFSEKAFNAVALHLEKSVTKEEDIDTAVEGVEDLLSGFQAEVDTRVTKAVEKAKKESETKPKEEAEVEPGKEGGEPGKTKTEPAKADEVPAWAKALIESNKKALDEISNLKAGKTSESRKQTLEAKLKDTNPALRTKVLKDFDRMTFATDEEFDTYVEETLTDLGDFVQTEVEGDLKTLGAPKKAAGGKKTEATKEEVKGVVDNIMP